MSVGTKIFLAFIAGAFAYWLLRKLTCTSRIDKSNSTPSTNAKPKGGSTACTSTWTDSNGQSHTCNGMTMLDNYGYTYCDCAGIASRG